MAEIDDFRPRIRNWARVYRDRFIRFESNLMMLIRALKRLDQTAPTEPRIQPDLTDAEFLDDCILALRQRAPDFEAVFPVLKAEYLTRYSNETYIFVRKPRGCIFAPLRNVSDRKGRFFIALFQQPRGRSATFIFMIERDESILLWYLRRRSQRRRR